MNVQLGRVLARERQSGKTFHRARVVAAVLGARRLDEQLAGLLAERARRYAQLGHAFRAQPVERPRYVQRQVALDHQARDLRRLAREYRLAEVERPNARRYCGKIAQTDNNIGRAEFGCAG